MEHQIPSVSSKSGMHSPPTANDHFYVAFKALVDLKKSDVLFPDDIFFLYRGVFITYSSTLVVNTCTLCTTDEEAVGFHFAAQQFPFEGKWGGDESEGGGGGGGGGIRW
ncbi:unnamed protein product [Mesocestoides corti]|uniref:GRAM domain-containing protein n=1 Tax=Mesocestoides corti TaxID=53468 RepID=A0A0R3U8K0_MESCO|nr:unnamed protein product [Mesocestoides corti]